MARGPDEAGSRVGQATAMLRSANALARQGHADGAVQAYRALLQLHPEFAEAHANLAFVLLAMRRFDEAAAHFRRVLQGRPDEVRVLLGLAHALRRGSHWRQAERQYRCALALRSSDTEAMLGLGVCLRSQSQLEAARAWFERAMVADPDSFDAFHLLAPLKRFAVGDPLLPHLEALQARVGTLPGIKQARYWFALGKVREDVVRYEDAFAAYAAGNRIRARDLVLDEAAEGARLQATCAVFDAARLSLRSARRDVPGRVPVFVVGMPRSGTTLVEQILASHPDVYGAGEITDLHDVLMERIAHDGAWPQAATGFAPEDLRALGDAYLKRAWRRAPHVKCIVNKTPANYLYTGLIRMILPEARIIHVVRDPMDACFSCYALLFRGDHLPYSYDLGTLGRYYIRYAQYMRHWRRVMPDAILDVSYEDLVTDTERQVRRLLDYLGLPWDPRCLDFHHNLRVVETASRAQVRRPIYRSSVGRWKRFAAHLQPLRELVEPWR